MTCAGDWISNFAFTSSIPVSYTHLDVYKRQEFTLQQEKYMIKEMKTMHRNKPNRMSDAEIMVILILFHSGGFRCFKRCV